MKYLLKFIEIVMVIKLAAIVNISLVDIAVADYVDQEVPTQINKRTNYLYEVEPDPDALMKNNTHSLEDVKGIIGDKDGTAAFNMTTKLSGVDSGAASSKKSELEQLDKNSMERKGREELFRSDIEKSLYINWEK